MTQTYGSLTLVKGFPTEVSVVRRGVSTPAASGFVAARQLHSSVSRQGGQAAVRTWTVEFKQMGTTDRDALLTAFRNALAGALPIDFTPPPPDDGATVPVRMTDEIVIEYDRSARAFRARITLEEAI